MDHRPWTIAHRPSSIVHRPSFGCAQDPSSIVHRPSSIVHRLVAGLILLPLADLWQPGVGGSWADPAPGATSGGDAPWRKGGPAAWGTRRVRATDLHLISHWKG